VFDERFTAECASDKIWQKYAVMTKMGIFIGQLCPMFGRVGLHRRVRSTSFSRGLGCKMMGWVL